MRVLWAIAISLPLISACQWVKPEQGSDNVALMDSDQVTECKKLAHTFSYVQEKIACIKRNDDAMREELVILAKNMAHKMEGDAVVPKEPLEKGKMGFDIYQCGK